MSKIFGGSPLLHWTFILMLLAFVEKRWHVQSVGILRFPQPSSVLYGQIKNVRQLLIDSKNRRLTLAAVNSLVQIDMDTFQQLHYLKIPTESSVLDRCLLRSVKKLCQNFFKVLLFDPDNRIFACGTNGGEPLCWRLESTTLQVQPELTITGVGRCSGNPRENVTSIFQGDYLFSATQLRTNQYTIFKAKAAKSGSSIRTHQLNSVLNQPQFVSSYNLGNGFVYFFFREVAIENVERKVVYSRVARVCQYDKGETIVSEDRFTTYLKSQLVCVDKSGQVPVYFDELQSTYLLEVHTDSRPEMFVYAVFSTSSEMLGSSAICRYKVQDIKNLFATSKYSEQANDQRWVPVSHPIEYPEIARAKCTPDLDTTSYNYKSAVFSMKHPLLYDDVKPFDGSAIFVMPGVSLTSLVVEDIHFKENSSDPGIHVIYTGSTDGAVYKVMVNSTNQGTPYVIETIRPFQAKQPVTSLRLSENAVFIATSTEGVARIPLDRCDQYLLCSDCVRSRDPFCAWNAKKSECRAASVISQGQRIQDISGGDASICPPVSGEISCTVKTVEDYPGAATVLQCLASGFPVPSILGWTKDDSRVVTDDVRFQVQNISSGKQNLIIKNYTVQDVGKYSCIVARGSARASCMTSLIGSEPVVNCSRYGEQCRCTIEGSPQPKSMRLVTGQLLVLGELTTVSMSSGVSLIAVNAFGEAGFTCVIPTEPPTQPPTSTAASTSTSASTASSTTATPTTTVEAPTTPTTTTTSAPFSAAPVPRKACPGCQCVSYRTPLIVVSVLLILMTILFCLIAVIFCSRLRRFTADEEHGCTYDADHTDGPSKVYIFRLSQGICHKPLKQRNKAVRNNSEKKLLSRDLNNTKRTCPPVVIQANHKEEKPVTDNDHLIVKQS